MKAAILNAAPGRLEFEELDIDVAGPREVRIRTAAVGLCHTDLHYVDALWRTELPEVLGHEASGIVESVGSDVTAVAPGDHVVTCMTAFVADADTALQVDSPSAPIIPASARGPSRR